MRKHDARHSRLLMCVADSQKPMQSTSRLPPPPGVLGAVSLGLDEPGERARVLTVDPPVANCVGSCGESGAMSGSSCLGGRLSEGPVDGVSGVNGRGPLKPTPTLVVLSRHWICLKCCCRCHSVAPILRWAATWVQRPTSEWWPIGRTLIRHDPHHPVRKRLQYTRKAQAREL